MQVTAARAVVARLAAAVVSGMTAFGMAGCAAPAAAAPPIRAGTAFVPVPQAGTTVAYLVIRNNGAADRLVSARISAGGNVVFLAPPGPGVSGARTVRAIAVPAHSTLALDPDGYHMMITGVPPMRAGQDVTLTLIFARAGPVSLVTQVTDPATGGSTYFLN
jgi:copper(I)-binding protein